MNASLVTADRPTHLKVLVVAGLFSMGAAVLATNLIALRASDGLHALAQSTSPEQVPATVPSFASM